MKHDSKPNDQSQRISYQKTPLFVCLAILLAIFLAQILSYLGVRFGLDNTDTFFFGNVQYAYATSDRSTTSDIVVVGCKNVTDLHIPEKVNDHKVVSIEQGVFNGQLFHSITVSAHIEIGKNVFTNAHANYITLENTKSINEYAFSDAAFLMVLKLVNVEKVESEAFSHCSNLTKVEIFGDKTAISIGENAFKNCVSLNYFEINQNTNYPDGSVSILENCNDLTDLKLKNFNINASNPSEFFEYTLRDLLGNSNFDYQLKTLEIENCGTIPDNFATDMSNLETVVVKKMSTNFIGKAAFKNTVLSTFEVPTNITAVGEFAFENSKLTHFDGSQLEYIAEGAFSGCTELIDFDLTKNAKITNIAKDVFSGCTSLTSIFVPQTVLRIASFAFFGCESLIEVEFQAYSQLYEIGENVFGDCKSLRAIYLPDSIEFLRNGAFLGCSSLEEITLPFVGGSKNYNKFFSYIFGATSADSNTNLPPNSLKKVTITKETTVPQKAFLNCNKIEEIIFSENLMTIENGAFKNCHSLRTFTISQTVSQIGFDAFSNCFRLFDLFNLSPLNITLGSTAFGGVGMFALNIYRTQFQEKTARTKSENFEFILSQSGKWYATSYLGNSEIIEFPKSFHYQSQTIDSYEIASCILLGNSFVKQIIVPSSVTAIGEYAFAECPQLFRVNIDESVNRMGFGLLKDSLSMSHLTVPFVGESLNVKQTSHLGYFFGIENHEDLQQSSTNLKFVAVTKQKIIADYAFYNFASIIQFDLRDDLISIGKYAFFGCNRISIFVVPDSVQSIGYGAFAECYALTKLTLPFIGGGTLGTEYLAYIFASPYRQSLSYQQLSEVTITKAYAVKDFAFFGVWSVDKFNLPDTVSSIGIRAFWNCSRTTEFKLPNSLVSIGEYAFADCYNLKTLNFPKSLRTIGEYAFTYCQNLQKLTLNSAPTIAEEAFNGCFSLFAVFNLGGLNLVEGSTQNGKIAYYAVKVFTTSSGSLLSATISGFEFKYFEDNWALVGYSGHSSNIELKEFVYQGKKIDSYSIKSFAFRFNSNITHIYIGKEVKSIDEQSFRNMGKLKTVTFDSLSKITVLKTETFYYCLELESVVLPAGLKTIDRFAFAYCEKLSSITLPATLEVIEYGAFIECTALKTVYNLSRTLRLSIGSTENGYVAYYAEQIL